MLPYLVTKNSIKKKLQVFQNQALKIIFKLPSKTSTNLIHAIANIDTIETRIKKLATKYILSACDINHSVKEKVGMSKQLNIKSPLLSQLLSQ